MDSERDKTALTVAEPPRVRNLRKRLAQIQDLDRRISEEGLDPNEEQLEKLSRRFEIQEELFELLEEAAETAREAAEKEAVAASRPTQPTLSVNAGKGNKKSAGAKKAASKKADNSRQDLGDKTPRLPTSPHRTPSMRWQDDPVAVEDFVLMPDPLCSDKAKRRPEEEVRIIEGVMPFSPAVQGDAELQSFLRDVTELSLDAFEEDALEMVTRKSRWKLTILARPVSENKESDDLPFIGFLVHKFKPDQEAFSIAKFAIVPEHRGKGHGCRLMDWCVKFAKKQANINYICVSSLPQAVRFYKKLGFRPVDVKLGQSCGPDEELIEGQVYMEYRLRGGRRKGR